MQQKNNNPYRRGQAMIMTVLVLSSTVLSLSAIGGYLMLVRLRTSSDIVSTSKAIYVADSGIECEAYHQFKKPAEPADFCTNAGAGRNSFSYDTGTVDETASYAVTYTAGPPSNIQSVGSFRNSNRAFQIDF